MIKFLTLILSISIYSLSFANYQFSFSDISYKQALKDSKSSDKKIMIFFSLPNNQYCQEVEETLFNDSEIADNYSGNFINIKINPNDKEGSKIAKKFNINLYPSIVFVNSSAEIIHKIIGVSVSTDMQIVAKKVITNERTLKYYQDLYSKNPKSFEQNSDLFLDYINTLYDAGEDYNTKVDLYFDNLTENQLKMPINVDAIIRYSKNIYSSEFKFFARNINQIKPLRYNDKDKYTKLENLISNQVIDCVVSNPKINPMDTLNAIVDFLRIEQRELVDSRVMLDYYNISDKDKAKYLDALMLYIPLHIRYLSSEQIADYSSKVLQSNNIEFFNQALMWTEEALNINMNPDLYLTRIQLLMKLNRTDEARDEADRFKEIFGSDNETWNNKISNLKINQDVETVPMKIVK